MTPSYIISQTFSPDLEITLETIYGWKLLNNASTSSSVTAYVEDFKLLAAEFDWNRPALRARFKGSLNKATITLIQQGTPCSLQDLYLAASHLIEVKAFFFISPSQQPSITTQSLPSLLDLDAEELMQIRVAR